MSLHHTTELSRMWLYAECLIFYIGVPLGLLLVKAQGFKFFLLWGLAFLALFVLRRSINLDWKTEWNVSALKPALPLILKRAVVCCAVLTGLLLYVSPEKLFSFPLERPQLWAMVMLLYPVLSVVPQEILFRSYIFHRYQSIFPGAMFLLASALIFGWAHIIFKGWIAVIVCVVGGYMLTHTYLKHRSLATVCFEHALYGCFIFTIGLGQYFYNSSN